MTVGTFQEINNMRSGLDIMELKQQSCNGNIDAFRELCVFCHEFGGGALPWQNVEDILGDVFNSILLNDFVDLFRHALQIRINTSIPEDYQLNLGGMVLDNYFSKLIRPNAVTEDTFRIVKMLFLDHHEYTRKSYLKIHQGFLLNQLSFSYSRSKIHQINWILRQIDIKINE